MSKGTVELTVQRKPQTDEWVMVWKANGVRDESKCYYGTDRDDVEAVLADTYDWAKRQGYSVSVPDRSLAARWHITPETGTFTFSLREAEEVGNQLGIDWTKVSLPELHKGMNVETEHAEVTGGEPETTAKIALHHLEELPDYYTRLEKMEKED